MEVAAAAPLQKAKGGNCSRLSQVVVAVGVGVVVDDGDSDEVSIGGWLGWWRSHLVSCGFACGRLMLQQYCSPDYKQCIGMVFYDRVF